MPFQALILVPQDVPAPVTEGGETAPSGPNFLFPLLLIGVIFWVVLIGPERKQRKKRQAMIDAIEKGDKVVTTAGIFATVVQVQDDVVVLQVAEGVRMRFSKSAVQAVLEEPAEGTTDKGDKALITEKSAK